MEGSSLGQVTVITIGGERYVTDQSLFSSIGVVIKNKNVWLSRHKEGKRKLERGIDYIKYGSGFLFTIEAAAKIIEWYKKPEVRSEDDELDQEALHIKRVREYYMKQERKGRRGRKATWERDPDRHINIWAPLTQS